MPFVSSSSSRKSRKKSFPIPFLVFITARLPNHVHIKSWRPGISIKKKKAVFHTRYPPLLLLLEEATLSEFAAAYDKWWRGKDPGAGEGT